MDTLLEKEKTITPEEVVVNEDKEPLSVIINNFIDEVLTWKNLVRISVTTFCIFILSVFFKNKVLGVDLPHVNAISGIASVLFSFLVVKAWFHLKDRREALIIDLRTENKKLQKALRLGFDKITTVSQRKKELEEELKSLSKVKELLDEKNTENEALLESLKEVSDTVEDQKKVIESLNAQVNNVSSIERSVAVAFNNYRKIKSTSDAKMSDEKKELLSNILLEYPWIPEVWNSKN